MKKRNRFIPVLLAFVLAFAALPFTAVPEVLAAGSWNTTWATSPVNSSVSISTLSFQDVIPSGTTLRTEFRTTTGGTKLRFKFSNQYGAAPVIINAISIAATNPASAGSVKPSTLCAVTFNNQYSVTIPAGGFVWSDIINYTTSPLDKLTLSMYFQNLTYITTAGLSNGKTYMNTRSLFATASSQAYTETLSSPSEITIGSGSITYHTIPFFTTLESYNTASDAATAVFIGDSTLVNDTYYHYAQRIMDTGARNVAVVNEAIVGNKLLNAGTGVIGNLYGDALISRFERDALSLAGVKYVFVKIGLNDILHQYTKSMASTTPRVSTADIINGYGKLISLCHSRGIKIYFFTKSPWKGYSRSFLGQRDDLTWSSELQNLCNELDLWTRSANGSDGYIDCSPLANPSDTYALCPSFTLDGAHLTDLASVALADLIPLSYVGISKTGRSAASLNGVDPYAEKNQIIKKMQEEPSTQPPVTQPPVSYIYVPTTLPQQNPQTPSQQNPTQPQNPTQTPIYTYPQQPQPTVVYVTPSTTEPNTQQIVPIYGTTSPSENVTYYSGIKDIKNYPDTTKKTADPLRADYNVSDDMPDSIGTNAPIGFILLLGTVIVASGATVIMTAVRKKEEDFTN